jgi:hypothetical protein
MNKKSTTSTEILDLLEGNWTGDGRGEFPGVTSFTFHDRLPFTRRDEKTLAYEERNQQLYDGQTEWLESHWENGFIRILESGKLELVSAQIGRSEVLIGTIDTREKSVRIHFMSKSIMNDPRVVSSLRTFELEGDTLLYEMEMQTTKVNQSTLHLKIALQRIK